MSPAEKPDPPSDLEEAASTGSLLKVLGVAFGIAVLVGNSIGMGILRTPGEVAQHLPSVGPFMAIWVLGAMYALLGALTVAELGAMHPRSGGLYPIVYDGLGHFPGFVSGWTDWISTCGSMAAVAIVLGEYVGPLIPALEGHEAMTGSAVIVGFALLQWGGVRIGNVTQQVTSLIKAVALVGLAVIALVLGGGTAEARVVTAGPEAVAGGTVLFAAVVVALQSAIFTYDGWTGPIYFGEEVRNPGRDVPRAMIGGVLVVLAIYLLLNLAFVRVLSIEEMAGDPFVAATAATRVFGPAGDTVLRVMMILSLIATVNALQLMASRVPYAMSRDGFLPSVLGRVNVGGTPVPALLLGTAVSVVFVLTNTFETALALIAFFFVANYVLTFTTLFVMRRRAPDLERPFRVPAYPWIPGIVLLGSIGFLVGALVSDTSNSLIALLFLAASWPVYWLLGRRAPVR